MVVADLHRGLVFHVSVDSRQARRLAEIVDDGDIALPPRVVYGSDGRNVAFTARRAAHDISELWNVANLPDGAACSLLTQIPGAGAHVLPFWSPKGKSLGFHVVHHDQGRSGTIVMQHLKGDGTILHNHERVDAAVTPAWSASGKHVAMFIAEQDGTQRLCLLDVSVRPVAMVKALDAAVGELRFLDARNLIVDGGDAVQIITFEQLL